MVPFLGRVLSVVLLMVMRRQSTVGVSKMRRGSGIVVGMPQSSRRKRSVAETVKVDTAVSKAAQALLSPVRTYRPEKTLSAREAVKRNRIAQRFATAFSVPLESCQQALKEARGNLMNTCKLILYYHPTGESSQSAALKLTMTIQVSVASNGRGGHTKRKLSAPQLRPLAPPPPHPPPLLPRTHHATSSMHPPTVPSI